MLWVTAPSPNPALITGRQFQPCPYRKTPAALTTDCKFEPCPYHWSPVEPCPYHRKLVCTLPRHRTGPGCQPVRSRLAVHISSRWFTDNSGPARAGPCRHATLSRTGASVGLDRASRSRHRPQQHQTPPASAVLLAMARPASQSHPWGGGGWEGGGVLRRPLTSRRGHPWRSSGPERGSEPATRTGASKITTCATLCRGAAQGPPSSRRGELGVSPRASIRRWVPRWTGSTRTSGRACTGGTAEPCGAVNRVGPAQARPRGLRDWIGSGCIGPGVLQPRGGGRRLMASRRCS